MPAMRGNTGLMGIVMPVRPTLTVSQELLIVQHALTDLLHTFNLRSVDVRRGSSGLTKIVQCVQQTLLVQMDSPVALSARLTPHHPLDLRFVTVMLVCTCQTMECAAHVPQTSTVPRPVAHIACHVQLTATQQWDRHSVLVILDNSSMSQRGLARNVLKTVTVLVIP